MTTDSYVQAVSLLRSGRPEAALEQFEDVLRHRPDNARAWNDAGAALFALGRYAEAIRYFQTCLSLTGFPVQVYRNLALAYLALGRPWQAMAMIEDLRRDNLLDAGIIQKIADGFLDQSDTASAMEVLSRGCQVLPEAAALNEAMAAIRGRRAKIAYFWGGDGPTFLNDILDYTRRHYEVRTFEGKTVEEMVALMEWSDISWFEWCTDLVVLATQRAKCCRTIVRLHRWEAYNHWPGQIDWSKIDTLMLVGNSVVKEALLGQVPDIDRQTSVITIPNGVDLNKYAFRNKKKGKKIVQLGHLRMIKRPDFALLCMKKLHAVDKDYHLHFAGWWQDLALQQYLMHMTRQLGLESVVHFDGYQTDVRGYLNDFDYNLSSSISESQGMGLLEAMAMGIKPVIHHFPGAEEIFGRDYLFNTPEEFCRLVCDEDYQPRAYREFVERRYPLEGQLRHINELLATFEKNPWNPSSRSDRPQRRLSALPV